MKIKKNARKKIETLKRIIRQTAGCISCKKKRGGKGINVPIQNHIKTALFAAKKLLKKNKSVQIPRIIPLPKTGGVLPLIPIFAGLSALGSLAGGASGIMKALNEAKGAKEQLAELQRHNKHMEAVAIRNGRGLYLTPYKSGLGIYLKKKK